MLRGKPASAESRTILVTVAWFFAVVLPFVGALFTLTPLVGTALGAVALRQPEPTRTQGALIIATSLFSFVMWTLIRSGAPGGILFLGS